ncbi:MAG TPA: SDR family oxidoreductase, partial [Xanthomonadales bacterium]|nr:SDR family oxidoreductase [Xanthomonadales bacterium]
TLNATVKKFGKLDTLVTCAGIVRRAEKIEETTEKEWDRQVNINLKGTFAIIHFALPELIKSERGVIVSISSTAASFGISGMATYSASKGGVSSLIRSIAIQYASVGLRANAISPGLIDTQMAYVDRPQPVTKVVGDIIEDGYPIKRIGKPEDIANAALFLASDQSSWITGQELFVDGGFSIK